MPCLLTILSHHPRTLILTEAFFPNRGERGRKTPYSAALCVVTATFAFDLSALPLGSRPVRPRTVPLMRLISTGYIMSSWSANFNPFASFALGAPATSDPSSGHFHPVPVRPIDNSRAKKMRTVRDSGGASRPGQDPPKGLSEKYRSPGEPEWPLRLIIVGHNPSEKAWELGHYYANPSNRMWKLLSVAGIVPPAFAASDDDDCPISCGVGFTDVGFSRPGTVSSEFKKAELHTWRQGFYDRLTAHAQRAAATAAAPPGDSAYSPAATAKTATGDHADMDAHCATACFEDGCPKVVAFAGKRQWEELFFDASAKAKAQTKGGKTGEFRFGLQPADLRPPGWPLPAQRTEVFVLPSSSGAAAMTNEAREAPYCSLGRRLSQSGEWTRRRSGETPVETP